LENKPERFIESIASELFHGVDIPEEHFKLFVEGIDRRLIKSLIFIYKEEYIVQEELSMMIALDNNLHLIETFKKVLTCALYDLPLYINEPFKEIISYRLNHQI
jgi:hypothetical protein